ncbi:Prophage CP4-57 regulatory [Halomonas sp. R57-5]|jgi:prophage regulatory protein|uniref:helix-turn-helix transcriptional regulator n=1 Tax=Halomonas sp. R57-5 TaxID=1610576 RepID=UPI0005FC905D|nr:AlpA family phage regulatory protein [Halomonas sp. R57-5]CEP36098.1 Prophage CP4-57 regulatory [Halomonas sp. R57-5]
MQHQELQSPVMLRLKHVVIRTGLSRSTIYNMLDEKSSSYDPDFPRQVIMSKAAVAWVEHEIDAWINNRIQKRNA